MKLEKHIGYLLKRHHLKIAVAESCSGGLIAHRITNVAGSSEYFDRGFIVYSNKAKIELLHVKPCTIKNYGAVSMQTAIEMAKGAKSAAKTKLGLAVTGIAGPAGGTEEKPVGLVYIAVAYYRKSICREFRFNGKREDIKLKTSQNALKMLKELLMLT